MEKAGEDALRGGAYREAVKFLSEALRLREADPAEGQGQPQYKTNIGVIWRGIMPDQLRLARWERQLGQAYYGLGNLAESQAHLQRALARLNRPMPDNMGALVGGILRQLGRQTLHRLWPALIRGRLHLAKRLRPAGTASQSALSLESARAYESLAQMHYLANEAGPAIYAALSALNMAEQAAPSPELARGYAVVGSAAGVIPLHRLAETYTQRAWRTTQTVQDRPALAWVLTVTGVYRIGVGHWSAAKGVLEEAVEIYEGFGDKRGWGDSLAVLGWADYFSSQFSRAPAWMLKLHQVASASDNLEHQAWALFGHAIHLLRQGQAETAIPMLEEAATLFTGVPGSRLAEMDNRAALALAYLRQGALTQAKTAADAAAHLQRETPPTAFAALDGYANIAAVYLALWEIEARPGPAKTSPLKAAAQRAVLNLRRHARIYPISRPYFWLTRGRYHWLSGKPAQAHQAWDKALDEARRLAMPYEQGLTLVEIGRHLADDQPDRQQCLGQARQIFERLGVAYDGSMTGASQAG